MEANRTSRVLSLCVTRVGFGDVDPGSGTSHAEVGPSVNLSSSPQKLLVVVGQYRHLGKSIWEQFVGFTGG